MRWGAGALQGGVVAFSAPTLVFKLSLARRKKPHPQVKLLICSKYCSYISYISYMLSCRDTQALHSYIWPDTMVFNIHGWGIVKPLCVVYRNVIVSFRLSPEISADQSIWSSFHWF